MSVRSSRSLARPVLWSVLAVVLGLVIGLNVVRRAGETALPPAPLSYLPGFVLENRDGQDAGLKDLAGSPWVADFIFTRCPGPCPRMTQVMADLGPKLPAGVRRVSFTVDPEYDTAPVLDAYAQGFAAPADWYFLTGPREAIWELATAGFKLGVAAAGAGGPEEQGPIVHSTRLVLVDGEGGIVGYYDAFDDQGLKRLVADARALIQAGH